MALSPSFARTLTPDEALARAAAAAPQKARSFLSSSPRLIHTGKLASLTTCYIFTTDRATLILGADELSKPVLGYIDRPVTDQTQMPDQLKWWLEEYGREIEHAQNARTTSKVMAVASTAPAREAAARTDIAPMLATTWDQVSPYNMLTPDPNTTVTGCVATAMAQVMKYYNYPPTGTGTVSVSYGGGTLTMNLDQTTFSWDKMLNSYADNAGTYEEHYAVANLMKACGYAAKMKYGSTSGATVRDMANAMVNNFKYDIGLDIVYRDYCTDEEWDAIVYDNLQKGHPILYSGVTESGGGHEFVCDGYRTDGYYHFNWGWSGVYDGYFTLSALNPEGQGTGGYEGGYNKRQNIVANINTPQEGSTQPDAWMCTDNSTEFTFDGRSVDMVNDYASFANGSFAPGTFDLGVILESPMGETTPVAFYYNQSIPVYYGTGEYGGTIPTSVADGAYTLMPAYNISGRSDWKAMKTPVADRNFPKIYLRSEGIYPDGSGNVTFSASEAEVSELTPGCDYTFTVSGTRKPGVTQDMLVQCRVIMLSTEMAPVSFTDYADLLMTDGNPVSITLSGSLDEDVQPGDYYMWLCDPWGYPFFEKVVTVNAPVTPASNVMVTSVAVDENIYIGKPFTATATAVNNGTADENSTATVYLFPAEEGMEASTAVGTADFVVPADGEPHDIAFNCQTPTDFTAGNYVLTVEYCTDRHSEMFIVEVKADQSGVNVIEVDAEARYYDLQGREVSARDLMPGIYIVRTAGCTVKVAVK